ncbi:hypothetical protein M2232_006172 [Bradyrhizobium japonicum]|nr:hypothetical protein [Bradyrhizobium japonicum]MCW2347252.1 hypothetical protein [Bradyrhizobium japonicum]
MVASWGFAQIAVCEGRDLSGDFHVVRIERQQVHAACSAQPNEYSRLITHQAVNP